MDEQVPIGALDDSVVIVDPEGVVLHANAAFQAWPAGTTDVSEGSNFWDSVPAEHLNQRRFVLSNVMTVGGVTRFVERVEGRWARISIHRLDPDDRQSPLAIVYRDIDVQVKAEEELKRLRLKILTVQEDERRVISQNLHDELGQGMTALLLTVRSLKDAEPTSPVLASAVGEATAQVELLTKRMRQIFYRIRPPSLQDASLADAMADYCATVAHSSGLNVVFDAEPDIPAIDGAKATALYRLLQESLNNVQKHARARSAWVSLTMEGESISIAVEDDGLGFDQSLTRLGIGLTGIEERFSMLEGESVVDARPGGGTRVSGSIPVGPHVERASR